MKIFGTTVALLLFIISSAQAGDLTLVGKWTSSAEGAGSFTYQADGNFEWTDGTNVSKGVWFYDPKEKNVSMILDPNAGIDDQAKVTVSNNGNTVELSFHQVAKEPQETPWVASYDRVQ